MVRVHLLISGKVQGVFYRQNTKENAKKLNLTGWVRNLSDGRVEALVEGEMNSVEKLIAWCNEGPFHAEVTDVQVTWEEYTGEFADFRVTG